METTQQPKTIIGSITKTTKEWIDHFIENATQQRIDWKLTPSISAAEIALILPSLQAWQLGETSDGSHLLRAASLYSKKIDDPMYVEAVSLFIKEEQKHGNNLGCYLDRIGKPRVKRNWGDSLFRKVRYFNTSMEIWTLAVIVVESTAQIFYQSLKNATSCSLLKQICTDILIDEAYHIEFQTERLAIIFGQTAPRGRMLRRSFYCLFFFMTASLVWIAHRKLFVRGGGNTYTKFMYKMKFKYARTIKKATSYKW